MTTDQLLIWVERQIADYAPLDADAGEVRNRFSQILRARAAWTGTGVFGFTIPSELVEAMRQPIAARLDGALATWREYLANIDGGTDYYERSVANAGLIAPPPRARVSDPAITNAVALLAMRLSDTEAATAMWRARGWLEDDEQHAFAIAPPSPRLEAELARMAITGEQLPPMLEALYGELDGLWVGGASIAGRREFDPDDEALVLAPIEHVLGHHLDVFILDQHPDHFSWVTLEPETGIISTANKLDRDLRRIAGSLVEYLEQLAAGYGRLATTR